MPSLRRAFVALAVLSTVLLLAVGLWSDDPAPQPTSLAAERVATLPDGVAYPLGPPPDWSSAANPRDGGEARELLQQASPRVLEVRVSSARDDRALRGATVIGNWEGAQTVAADAWGVARLVDIPRGVVCVRASAPQHVRAGWTRADTGGDVLPPVTIALAPALTIAGDVVDASDGQEVAGARLELRDGVGSAIFGDPPLANGATDIGGRFVLDGVPAAGGVTLLVMAVGYAAHRTELHLPSASGERTRIVLSRAATLRGHVVTAAAVPVEGAIVCVVPTDRPTWLEQAGSAGDRVGGTPPWLQGSSGPDGAFEVPGITLDRSWVALAVTRATGASPPSPALEPRALPADLVLTLPASGRLVVQVLDEHGAAIEQAVVRLGTRLVHGRRAEAEGAARHVLEALAPGPTGLRVEAKDRVPQQLRPDVLPGRDTVVQVRLPRGLAVAGLVVDAEGRAIEGAEVHVRGEGITHETTSDREGRFVLAGLLAGDVRVAAWSDEHAAATVHARPPADSLRLVLPRLATVTWRVRLPAGASTANGNVLQQVFRGKGDADPVTGVDGWSRRTAGLLFVDGVATITWRTLDLSRAVVFTHEFAPVAAHAKPQAGQSLDLGEVTLGPGRTVRGSVQDDQGRAVARARVFVRERPTSKQQDLRTAADGTFELTQLGDGPVPFSVSAPGHGGAQGIASDRSFQVVVLPRYRRITVRVLTAAGIPAAGESVRLHRLQDGREREAHGLQPDERGTGALVADVGPAHYRVRVEGGPSADVDATGTDDPPVVVLRVR